MFGFGEFGVFQIWPLEFKGLSKVWTLEHLGICCASLQVQGHKKLFLRNACSRCS